jgi:hemolysin activation/secretion protein
MRFRFRPFPVSSSSRLAALGLIAISPAICAQALPDAGILQRESERDRQMRDVPALPAPDAPPAEPPAMPAGPVVRVDGFRLEGASLIPESELQSELTAFTGRELSLADLYRAADRLSDVYRRNGWYARVIVPAGDVREGIVVLRVLEGQVGSIEFSGGAARFTAARARPYVLEGAREGEPIRLDALARSALLLNDIPGVDASVVLAPAKESERTDLHVELRDKPLFNGNVSLDNYGTRSTGATRLSTYLGLDNPAGWGEQYSLAGSVSRDNANGRLSASYPLGSNGMRMSGYGALLHYRLGAGFSALDASGSAATMGSSFSWPLVRGETANLNLLAVSETRRYENLGNGNVISNKAARSLSVGLNGDRLDSWLGGGLMQMGATVTSGRLDLAGSATDFAADQAGPRRHGSYAKFGWQFKRLQRIDRDDSVLISFMGQAASRNLDSSEQFGLGGPFGVRAYSSLEASGDSGWLGSVEWRRRLSDTVQLSGFYDTGRIRLHRTPWSGWNSGNPALPNQYSLSGVGAGLAWAHPKGYVTRFTVARTLGENPGRDAQGRDAEGRTGKLRAWLTVALSF